MKEFFEIGIVTGVHGVRGDIKVFPYTHDPENLSKQKFFIIDGEKTEVQYAKMHGKFLIIHIDSINTREDAENMKGTILCIPRENAAPLPEGQYYMDDLIGSSVFEGEKNLGILEDIMETGANDVYCVVDEKGREILIPAIKGVLLEIDINGRRIDVALPEGLTDDEYV